MLTPVSQARRTDVVGQVAPLLNCHRDPTPAGTGADGGRGQGLSRCQSRKSGVGRAQGDILGRTERQVPWLQLLFSKWPQSPHLCSVGWELTSFHRVCPPTLPPADSAAPGIQQGLCWYKNLGSTCSLLLPAPHGPLPAPVAIPEGESEGLCPPQLWPAPSPSVVVAHPEGRHLRGLGAATGRWYQPGYHRACCRGEHRPSARQALHLAACGGGGGCAEGDLRGQGRTAAGLAGPQISMTLGKSLCPASSHSPQASAVPTLPSTPMSLVTQSHAAPGSPQLGRWPVVQPWASHFTSLGLSGESGLTSWARSSPNVLLEPEPGAEEGKSARPGWTTEGLRRPSCVPTSDRCCCCPLLLKLACQPGWSAVVCPIYRWEHGGSKRLCGFPKEERGTGFRSMSQL